MRITALNQTRFLIRILGFDEQKLEKINIVMVCLQCFFLSKIAFYLSLGLIKRRPSYRRSLQHFKTWLYFCLPGSGSGSTDLIESGSETLTCLLKVDTWEFCLSKRGRIELVLYQAGCPVRGFLHPAGWTPHHLPYLVSLSLRCKIFTTFL